MVLFLCCILMYLYVYVYVCAYMHMYVHVGGRVLHATCKLCLLQWILCLSAIKFSAFIELTKCCRESSHSQLLLVILPDLKCFSSYPLFTVLISVYGMILSFSLPTTRLLCITIMRHHFEKAWFPESLHFA